MPQVYEPEFKRKLVRLHLEEGRSYKSLTQEYGVSKSAISKWVELFSNECQKKVNADPTALNDADLKSIRKVLMSVETRQNESKRDKVGQISILCLFYKSYLQYSRYS